jgi:hypothetical protein
MVTIIGYSQRLNKEGKPFIALQIQGDITLVQSKETGHWYATAKRASMTSTFDEQTAQSLVGKTIPGKIERVQCEDYEYVVPETGEAIVLSHRYEFVPESEPTPMRVVHSNLAA